MKSLVSSINPVTLIKCHFLANFHKFQNTQKKYTWSLFLLNSKILDFRAVILEEKAQFCKDLIQISWALGYSPVFKLKCDSTINNFLEMQLSSKKIGWILTMDSWQWIPVLVEIYNISKNRFACRRFPMGYCQKYHVQDTYYGLLFY